MVLDVTSLLSLRLTLLWRDSLELSHNHFHWLTNDIGKSVESTTMGHTNDENASASLSGSIDHVLEAWHERFTTLEAESLHRVELAGHEGAPRVRPVHSLVHLELLSLGTLLKDSLLKLLTDPVTLLLVLNVHELHSDLSAVRILVSLDQVPHLPVSLLLNYDTAEGALEVDRLVKVLVREAVAVRVQALNHLGVWQAELVLERRHILVVVFQRQGIQFRLEVTVRHKRSQKHRQTDRLILSSADICCGAATAHNTAFEGGEDLGNLGVRSSVTESWWKLEGATVFLALEVGVPTAMDARWILLPLRIDIVDVVGVCAAEEVVLGGEGAARLRGQRHLSHGCGAGTRG